VVLTTVLGLFAAIASVQLVRSYAERRELEHEVGRLRRALAEAERQAMTDGLTGVHNRRVLEDQLERAIRRAERTGGPFTVLMIDVDGLKRVNDRTGHASGDDVLRGVARVASEVIRGYDLVARVGGDEFVVLLHDAGPDQARATAERIRARAESAFEASGISRGTTVSIGSASWAAGRAAATLLAEADASMYAAKRARRQETVRV